MTAPLDKRFPRWVTEQQDLLDVLGRVAPGTGIRFAVERVVSQGNGALVVIGSGPDIERISAGGFKLVDTDFSPAMLAELAKLDGAIILDEDIKQILAANVHMIPDPAIVTDETGARFRTAERLARSTGRLIIAVSEERRQGFLFFGDRKEPLKSPTEVLLRINGELHTLERFRYRLTRADERLARSRAEDQVTLGAALAVLQQIELLHRICIRLEHLAVGLGEERSMVELQVSDIMDGVREIGDKVWGDFFRDRENWNSGWFDLLQSRPLQDLYDTEGLCAILGLGSPDTRLVPLGA